MAVMTLEEIKKGMADKVFDKIVDVFLRQSDMKLRLGLISDCQE